MLKFFALLVAFNSTVVFADSAPRGQSRLFAGGLTASPDQMNTVLEAGGLESMKTVGAYGVEGSYALLPQFNLGIRFVGKYAKVREKAAVSAVPANPYYASLQSQAIMASARIALISTSFFIVDVFGGAGYQNAKVDIRTSSGDGYYDGSQKISPVSQYGASMGFGFKNVYLFAEVGQENSKLSEFTRTGTTSSSIEEINTGGPFVFIGLCMNGVPGITRTK